MPAEYDEGDIVRYKPVGGMPSFFLSTVQTMLMDDTGPDSKTSEAVGTIRGVTTQDQNMTQRNVHASKEHPKYEVRLPSSKVERKGREAD